MEGLMKMNHCWRNIYAKEKVRRLLNCIMSSMAGGRRESLWGLGCSGIVLQGMGCFFFRLSTSSTEVLWVWGAL